MLPANVMLDINVSGCQRLSLGHTQHERRDTASQINQSFEELDDDVEDACKEVDGERECVLYEMRRSREEGPDDFDEGLDKVGK